MAAAADRTARGRIGRQGSNQHDEIDIFSYATEGSLDATMWQNNERKARFIAASLSCDTSIRRLKDMGAGQANQFTIANKVIASGDQKTGLEADTRLERLRAAHLDDQMWCAVRPASPNATWRSQPAASLISARRSTGAFRPPERPLQ